MEANLIAHLIDLEVACIAEAIRKPKPHVPTNSEHNSGSRCESEYKRDPGRWCKSDWNSRVLIRLRRMGKVLGPITFVSINLFRMANP